MLSFLDLELLEYIVESVAEFVFFCKYFLGSNWDMARSFYEFSRFC